MNQAGRKGWGDIDNIRQMQGFEKEIASPDLLMSPYIDGVSELDTEAVFSIAGQVHRLYRCAVSINAMTLKSLLVF
jgi:hypothetical protein